MASTRHSNGGTAPAPAHGSAPIRWRGSSSSEFATAVLENWQSEYLQFTLFIILTVWLVQRGSPESKEPGKAGRESDRDQRIGRHAGESAPRWARTRGLKLRLYENSLLIVMVTIWIGSWWPNRWSEYLTRADFWEKTPELAVGVPRGGLDGDPRRLPPPARLPRVEAGGGASPGHRHGELSGFSENPQWGHCNQVR